MSYSDQDLLQLSGIQHFLFCRRQWALIHVENQWHENVRTIEGKDLHERVDDPFFDEKRKGIIISRSMPIVSYELGLSGLCDLIEFIPDPNGIHLQNASGTYAVTPVEYKRGHEKQNSIDEVQLCAQAICLEHMLMTTIPFGYIFYNETRRRTKVLFNDDLRNLVIKLTVEMHEYFLKGYTPKSKPSRSCKACSLIEICLPEITDLPNRVRSYIQKNIEGMTP